MRGPSVHRVVLCGLVGAGLVLLAGSPVSAIPGESKDFTIPAGETTRGDRYFAAEYARIEGTHIGDLTGVVAHSLVFDGDIHGDVNLLVPNFVVINGTIHDSLRAFSNELTIAGTVARDALLVGGGNLTIAPDGHVRGNLLIPLASAVTLRGRVDGDVDMRAGKVLLGGTFGGNVRLKADRISVEPGTTIAGDLTWVARGDPPADLDAIVAGEIVLDPPDEEAHRPGAPVWKRVGRWLWRALLPVAVGCLLAYPFRRRIAGGRPAGARERGPLVTGLIGTFAFVVLPIAVAISVLVAVTVPLGLLRGWDDAIVLSVVLVPGLTATYLLTLFLAQIPALAWLGSAIGRAVRPRPPRTVFVHLLIGGLAARLLASIPYVGWLATLAIVWLGLGAVVIGLYDVARSGTDGIGDRASRGILPGS